MTTTYIILATNATYGIIINGSFTVNANNIVIAFFINGSATNIISPTGITTRGNIVFANILLTNRTVITYTSTPEPNPPYGSLPGSQTFFPEALQFGVSNGILIKNISNSQIKLQAEYPNTVFEVTQNGLSYYNTSNVLTTISDMTIIITPIPTCFKEDSLILCLINDLEFYMHIQNIKKGMLVKTLENGYKAVNVIGKSKFINPEGINRSREKLYKLSREKYPELIKDLYITGGHSILVGYLSNKQRNDIMELFGRIYTTENQYRLMACIDEKTEVVEEREECVIWHLALDNENYFGNYGIYANGLVVESCNIAHMVENSGMELME
jgi:hypothetical protein